jgi:GAF domain-containing protein
MSRVPDSRSADPQEIIADLRRQLEELAAELQARTAERDDLERQLTAAGEQQTATAEVLGVINSSPEDLGPVFNAVLEKALRLCGAVFGNLLTFDGDHFHGAAGVYSEPISGERELRREPFRPISNGPLDRLVRGENLVYAEDARSEIAYRTSPEYRQLVDAGGYRSMVYLALRKEAQLLGAIVIFFGESRPITDKQIVLLKSFAAQAVIAMDNARLLTETREALEQQTATAEVLGVINSSPGDLASVFEAILEKAHALGGASRGTLFLFDGEFFRQAASHGYPEGSKRPDAISVADDQRLAALAAGEQLIHVPDLAQLDDPIARSVVARGGVRTNLLLPLRKEGVLLGVLSCNRAEVRPFTEKQIALLQNFAAQAVIAIENARLLGELRQRTEEVAELNRGLEARVAEQVEELGRQSVETLSRSTTCRIDRLAR